MLKSQAVRMGPLLITLCLACLSCTTIAPQATSPADAIQATYTALEAQDSAALMATLSQDKIDEYAALPGHVREMLDRWKGRHATMKVLSITQNDTMATVLYDLTVTGPNPRVHDSIYAHTYKENGEWKHGY